MSANPEPQQKTPWYRSRTIYAGIILIVIPTLTVFNSLLGDGTPFDKKDAVLVLTSLIGGLVIWLRVITTTEIGARTATTPSEEVSKP